MNSLTFGISDWAAWAPGISSAGQWQDWLNSGAILPNGDDVPDVAFIPAMTRRRLSRLTKIALRVVRDVVPDGQPLSSVFASRHGELHRTTKLLQQFAAESSMSPTGFSMSVHNTCAGLHSILNKDHSQTTAIAAGTNTFFAGIMEAVLRLQAEQDVLFVYVDERIPEFYRPYTDAGNTLGFAARLSLNAGQPFELIQTSAEPRASANATTQNFTFADQSLNFIRFLLSPTESNCSLSVAANTHVWRR